MAKEVVQSMDNSVIQIWNNHSRVDLSSDRLIVRIKQVIPFLPEEVKQRVLQNWGKVQKDNPKAKDNQIAYLLSYEYREGNVKAEVFLDRYSLNQWFNLDDTGMQDTAVAIDAGYTPFTSWMIALCDNANFALFGRKTNYGEKKVSGFGGYTSQADVTKEGSEIDVKGYMQRKMREELGELAQRIRGIDEIGLNFFPKVGHRTFNGVYVMSLDGKPEDIQKGFTENAQFSKELIPVEATPSGLVAFLENPLWQPTWSCVGGVVGYIMNRFGRDELNQALETYTHKSCVKILDEPFNGCIKERIMEETTPFLKA